MPIDRDAIRRAYMASGLDCLRLNMMKARRFIGIVVSAISDVVGLIAKKYISIMQNPLYDRSRKPICGYSVPNT